MQIRSEPSRTVVHRLGANRDRDPIQVRGGSVEWHPSVYSLSIHVAAVRNGHDALATRTCSTVGSPCQTAEIRTSTAMAQYVLTQVQLFSSLTFQHRPRFNLIRAWVRPWALISVPVPSYNSTPPDLPSPPGLQQNGGPSQSHQGQSHSPLFSVAPSQASPAMKRKQPDAILGATHQFKRGRHDADGGDTFDIDGSAQGAKHWTDEEKTRLFTWLMGQGQDDHWSSLRATKNSCLREVGDVFTITCFPNILLL